MAHPPAAQSWSRTPAVPARFALAACLLLAAGRLAAFEEDPAAAAKPDSRSNPVAIHTISPVHPPGLRQKLINGDAEVECLISEQGRVVEARVISASQPEFGEAAETAARQWEFRPAERNGTPVAMRVRIPFSFQMTGAQMLEIAAGRSLYEEVKDSVIPAEQLPNWPTPKQIILPKYPTDLRGSGKYGKAVVAIVINKEGKVVNPKIVKYTYPEFIWPALAAAVSMEFPPQLVDRTPIFVSMELQFDFAAEGGKPKVIAPDPKKTPLPQKSGG